MTKKEKENKLIEELKLEVERLKKNCDISTGNLCYI